MNDEYKQTLGNVLAAKRLEARIPKQQLALMVGINRLTVRHIECGESNPTIGTLLRITQGLGLSLADVMVETERSLIEETHLRPPVPSSLRFDAGSPTVTYFITRL